MAGAVEERQISNAARVARDANTHECVVMPGGHAPTRSNDGQGHRGAGASGSAAQRRAGCWAVKKNLKQDECVGRVSGFLFCHAHEQRVQPYLGPPPARGRDQIQSAVAKNDIKSDPKIPSKTCGF